MAIDYSDALFALPKSRPRVLDRQDKAKADEREERRVKALVRARDGGQCRILGCRAKPTEAHHIVKRSQSKVLRWEPSNLVTLCRPHHQLAEANVLTFRGDPESDIFSATDTRTGRPAPARAIR